MNKHIILLALETLLEQLNNDSIWIGHNDHKDRVKEVKEQIKIIKL